MVRLQRIQTNSHPLQTVECLFLFIFSMAQVRKSKSASSVTRKKRIFIVSHNE